MSVVKLTPGGSKYGLHFWSTAGECPRKFQYKQMLLDTEPSWSPPGTEDKPNALMIGTLYHAYHEHGILSSPYTFDYGVDTQYTHEENEAWRLASFYKTQYPDWRVPQMKEFDLRLDVNWLSLPLTGRIDALVRIDGFIDGCSHRFEKGLYVWDYKTASAYNKWFVEEYRLQVEDYCWKWNLLNPNDPVLGGVLDNVIKTKTPKAERHYVPGPTAMRCNDLKSMYMHFDQQRKNTTKNLTACKGTYSMCSFKSVCDQEE